MRSDKDPLIQYARPAWYVRTSAHVDRALPPSLFPGVSMRSSLLPLSLALLVLCVACDGSASEDLGFSSEEYDEMKPRAAEVATALRANPYARETRVMLLGLDSADMDIIDEMIRNGDLPAFRRLKEEGATGRLISITPLLSPVIWTTIATGKDPSQHRVLDFVVPPAKPGMRPSPVSSFHRQVESVWDILGTYGVTACHPGRR